MLCSLAVSPSHLACTWLVAKQRTSRIGAYLCLRCVTFGIAAGACLQVCLHQQQYHLHYHVRHHPCVLMARWCMCAPHLRWMGCCCQACMCCSSHQSAAAMHSGLKVRGFCHKVYRKMCMQVHAACLYAPVRTHLFVYMQLTGKKTGMSFAVESPCHIDILAF